MADDASHRSTAKTQRRAHARRAASVTAQFCELDQRGVAGPQQPCVITNISCGGMALATIRMIHPETLISITIPAANGPTKTFHGRVRRVAYAGGEYRLGVQFVEATALSGRKKSA